MKKKKKKHLNIIIKIKKIYTIIMQRYIHKQTKKEKKKKK